MKTLLLCLLLSSCAAQKQYGYKKNKDFGVVAQHRNPDGAKAAHWMATITIVIVWLYVRSKED